MANTATVIVLTAGTLTFANDWYQTKQIQWRIPVATVLAAAVFDGLAKIDERAATFLAVMVAIGAATAKFGGKSITDTLSDTFGKNAGKAVKPFPQKAPVI